MEKNTINKSLIKYLKDFQENTKTHELNYKIRTESDQIYNKILQVSPKIFGILNDHKGNSKKWEFIFAPWLRFFLISIIYKRFFYIYLLKNKIDLNFLKIKQNEIVKIFNDHNDFMFNSNNLEWNCLCLKIFHEFENKKDIPNILNKFNFRIKNNTKTISYKSKIKYLLSKCFYNFFLKEKYTYFTFPNRFSYLDKFSIFKKTKGGVYFEEDYYSNSDKNLKFEPNINLREKIRELLFKEGDLNLSYAILFSLFLPLSKFENYNFNKSQSLKTIFKKKKFKTLISQGSHIDNEIKLHQLYLLDKNKIKIKVIQHGNNYDLIEKKYHTGIEHEYIFQNELYTWGWSNNKNEIKVTSPRLMNFKRQFQKFKKIKNPKKILYIVGPSLIWNFPRSLHISHNFYNKSANLRNKFFEVLGKEQRNKVILRTYPYKSYHGMNDFLEEKKARDINLSKNSKLIDDVNKSFLLIFDHLSTANLECASINKPFLIFFKSDSYLLSERGKEMFKLLKDNNIYHDDYKSLSELVSQINEKNILNWWNEKKRSEAISKFLKKYAYFSPTALDDWSKLINKNNEF